MVASYLPARGTFLRRSVRISGASGWNFLTESQLIQQFLCSGPDVDRGTDLIRPDRGIKTSP
jgi:hypothetical protein